MDALLIAAIGAGGKTTALRALAQSARSRRVLFTTTTHIFPLAPPECRVLLTDPAPEQLLPQLGQPGIVCAGTQAEAGKLGPLPVPLFSQAVSAAQLTLCEADGAHRRPLKLHRPNEPVIPAGAGLCLVAAGLSALGRPVGQAVHRYERNPQWASHPERIIGPEEFLYCLWETIQASSLPYPQLRIWLNQADLLSDQTQAVEIAQELCAHGLDCRLGSAAQDPRTLSSWLLE